MKKPSLAVLEAEAKEGPKIIAKSGQNYNTNSTAEWIIEKYRFCPRAICAIDRL